MKAIVLDISKFSTRDGPGIRTVVFLKGCPLRCMWCHSPESWSPEPSRWPDGSAIGHEMSEDEVLAEVLKDRDFYEESGGGVTVSGGEPLFRADFTASFLAKCRDAGLHTAVETSGYAPRAAVEKVRPFVDLWLFDIKGLDPARHRAQTGVDNAAILANLRALDETGAKIVLRCPMIPGLNDADADLAALGRLADSLKGVERIDVEPYVPFGINKAHRLGLKVYEAPMPPPDYADAVLRCLRTRTRRAVAQ